MEKDKIDLILGFDVLSFLDWHRLFYSEFEAPNFTDLLENEANYQDWVRNFKIKQEAKLTFNVYGKIGTPIVSKEKFEELETLVYMFISSEFTEISEKFNYWQSKSEIKAKQVIDNKKNEIINNLIDFDLLESFNNDVPILENNTGVGIAALLSNVKIFQILENWFNEDNEKTPPSIVEAEPKAVQTLPPSVVETEPKEMTKTTKILTISTELLKWNGTKQSLYYMFHLLQHAQKIKNGDTDIAKHIASNYQKTDGAKFDVKDIETIRKQVNDTNPLPNTIDRTVLEIINKAVLDIDKVLKIK